MKEKIVEFIEKRPEVKAAYGYGSGVFKQSGYTDKDKPQLDLILVVDNLKDWHLKNIKLNPKDYSFTGKVFFKNASESKLKGKTGITYLSNIEEGNLVFKYGTIELKDLEKYLTTWESFYLPGRFQKAVYPIKENKDLTKKIELNRQNALLTALLTLPEDKKNLIDIYVQICGLSYLGDTRMKFAENPRKVLNIVEGSLDAFKEIYKTENEYFEINKNDEVAIEYDKLLNDIDKLPSSLLEYLGNDNKNKEEVCEKILSYFTKLNKEESTKQTIKGIYTNGIVRSVKYASKKVLKKIKK